MAAAYRWFDNEKVTFDQVLQPHIDATRKRTSAQPLVLLAQDTTEIDVTRPEQQMHGAGPLDSGSHRGMLLHLMHAFTPDGTPLGTIHALPNIRDDAEPGKEPQSHAERAATPIEEKESFRWVESLQQTQEVARLQPDTEFVCLADSEGDIYELMAETLKAPENAHWIVRACQDRALLRNSAEKAKSAVHLRDELLAQPVLYTDTIMVRARKAKVDCEVRGRRQPRVTRKAEVEARAMRVTLRPPYRKGLKLPAVSVNVVMLRELNPPEGEEAVEWILLTDLPIDTIEEVRTVVHHYTIRWTIEVFFRTLKTGCKVERRRFENIDRVLPCLAVYLIVTWRTLFVCRLGREIPDASCEVVFEPAEWKSVYRVVLGETPKEPPTLKDMIRTVAQLGGYVKRRRNDPPGAQTVWIGMQRLHDITRCWKLFGPESADRDG